MKTSKLLKISFLILVMIFLSGCLIKVKKIEKGSGGGIYLSRDKGVNWTPVTPILTSNGTIVNFQNEDINFLLMDPTDSRTFYASTNNALYYTYNGMAGWQKTLVDLGKINDLAIDEKNHCQLYAALGNRLYKSHDCGRFWDYTFIEQNNPAIINAVVVNSQNPKIVLAGTAANGLFKSEDSAFSWHVIRYFDSPVIKILTTAKETNTIYLVTAQNGVYRSLDGGVNWLGITGNIQTAMNQEKIEKSCSINDYRNLVIDPQNSSRLLYATNCLFETTDRGDSWQQIKLLTRPNETDIYGLAISYSDSKEFFYGTPNIFYRTLDNGQNWITKDLPTARTATQILTHPDDPNLIYLGTNSLLKK